MSRNQSQLYFSQPLDYPLVTVSDVLVVSLNEVKAQLRIDLTNTSEDALLTTYIRAATLYFERITGRDLIIKTYKTFLNNFPGNYAGYGPVLYAPYNNYDEGIILLKSKLQAITHIKYYDTDGILQTVDAAKYYITDQVDYAAIFIKNNQNWPTDIEVRQQAITITFTAGFGPAASDVPEDIKEILLMMVTNMYENRGDCGGDCSKISDSIKALIMARKILWM
jgi:uncharacterized phiE125 gp8 family phage protein